MKRIKALRMLVACLLWACVAAGLSGCGYSSPFSDHFVRGFSTVGENDGELRSGFERYVELERARMPKRKIYSEH